MWYACDMGSSAALLEAKFKRLRPHLNEASLRLWAANEALSLGYGGVSDVSRATGLSRTTIHAGIAELGKSVVAGERVRVRRTGGGRKTVTEKDPGLSGALNKLVDPGDARRPGVCSAMDEQEHNQAGAGVEAARTPCFTTHCLRSAGDGGVLTAKRAQDTRVRNIRIGMRSSITSTRRCWKRSLEEQLPVVSVDTKKKELVGDFKNAGQEWQRKGDPVKARVHDFVDPALGKAAPYGVYDLAANQGWVSVGIDHDTAAFAAQSIRRWWQQMGNPLYPAATRLLITADCGGSNGYRVRLWKVALQRFANETNLTLQVCHLPPGTSKWNKIEHRMFCHITQNWRGRPLESLAVIVSLIGNTTTAKGLKIRAEIDASKYPKGQKVSDQELALVQIHPDAFHGEWNYAILPQSVE